MGAKALSSVGWEMKSRSVRAATGRAGNEPYQSEKTVQRGRSNRATAHVECRKDAEVIDEIPMRIKILMR